MVDINEFEQLRIFAEFYSEAAEGQMSFEGIDSDKSVLPYSKDREFNLSDIEKKIQLTNDLHQQDFLPNGGRFIIKNFEKPSPSWMPELTLSNISDFVTTFKSLKNEIDVLYELEKQKIYKNIAKKFDEINSITDEEEKKKQIDSLNVIKNNFDEIFQNGTFKKTIEERFKPNDFLSERETLNIYNDTRDQFIKFCYYVNYFSNLYSKDQQLSLKNKILSCDNLYDAWDYIKNYIYANQNQTLFGLFLIQIKAFNDIKWDFSTVHKLDNLGLKLYKINERLENLLKFNEKSDISFFEKIDEIKKKYEQTLKNIGKDKVSDFINKMDESLSEATDNYDNVGNFFVNIVRYLKDHDDDDIKTDIAHSQKNILNKQIDDERMSLGVYLDDKASAYVNQYVNEIFKTIKELYGEMEIIKSQSLEKKRDSINLIYNKYKDNKLLIPLFKQVGKILQLNKMDLLSTDPKENIEIILKYATLKSICLVSKIMGYDEFYFPYNVKDNFLSKLLHETDKKDFESKFNEFAKNQVEYYFNNKIFEGIVYRIRDIYNEFFGGQPNLNSTFRLILDNEVTDDVGPKDVAKTISKSSGVNEKQIFEIIINIIKNNKNYNFLNNSLLIHLINFLKDESNNINVNEVVTNFFKLNEGQILELARYERGLIEKLPEKISDDEKKSFVRKLLLKNKKNGLFHSAETAYRKYNDLFSTIHNIGDNLTIEQIESIIENPISKNQTSVLGKELNELMISVFNFGGSDRFIKDNQQTIDYLKSKNLISKDFDKNLKGVVEFYFSDSVKDIFNQESNKFQQLKNKLKTIQKEIDLISNFESFKEHYETASKEENKKKPELFKLDDQINDYLRFRVLPDLDFEYFNVGTITDCCQRIGGAGEDALIDSFINPLAGVVVLEYKQGEHWEIVAQSYFHWVPEENGFILDNVEVNPSYKNNIVSPSGKDININSIYSYWAKKKKEELGLAFFEAGTAYSELDSNEYFEGKLKEDPRHFESKDIYTDYKPISKAIDLLAPQRDIIDISKIAKYLDSLSKKFFKQSAIIENNLKDYLNNNPNEYKNMEHIDQKSFEKYDDFDYSQSSEDIQDDFYQVGANGVGLLSDQGSIIGYIYGYQMTNDEIPEDIDKNISNKDFVQEFGAVFYKPVPEQFYKQLLKLIKNKKVFYVSNLALPENKTKLPSMINELIKSVKSNGYDFISIDALSDSMRLFLDSNLKPKVKRIEGFGIDLVCIIPEGTSVKALFEIK